MTRREQALLGGLAFAIILGAISLHFHRDRIAAQEDASEPVKIPVPPAGPAASGSAKKESPARAGDSTANAALAAPIAAALASGPTPASGAPDPKPPSMLAVAAMGAVQHEGLYRLAPGSRVNDLIEKAGGTAEQADLSEINLAAPLIDGTTLTLPKKREWTQEQGALRGLAGPRVSNPPQYLRGYSAPAAIPADAGPQADSNAVRSASGKKGSLTGAINLNTASIAELESLSGVGPKTAQAIVDLRPYSTVDQLLDVKGIGPKKMEQLRSLVTAP